MKPFFGRIYLTESMFFDANEYATLQDFGDK
jgi:hypothetical protein